MLKKSISYKLSIYISLAVISVFILFIAITYFFNQRLLRENIEHRAIGLSSEVNSSVNKQLVSTKEITFNLANQAMYYIQNDDIDILTSQVLQKYHFLNAIYINIDSVVPVTNHSFFISRKGDSIKFDAEKTDIFGCENARKIFREVVTKKSSQWTEPFRCDEDAKIFVSFYAPITQVRGENDTVLIGSVVSELSLYYLNQTIDELNTGNGYAFLIDKSGRYITHPVKEWILNKNIKDLSKQVFNSEKIDYEDIFKNNLSGSAIAYPKIYNYKKSWIYYTPIHASNWHLIFVMPYHELFSGLYRVTLRLFFLALIGIITIFFMVTYISKTLIKPLRDVTDKLSEFSSQTGISSDKSYNEVRLVAESLKSLKHWYKLQKDEQNRVLIRSNLQKQDLMQASEIQQSIIKTEFPALPDRNEIDLHAVYKPAREVSGDLYDFFFITDDELVFTIGDVSGKGVPAAIFMSIAQTIIKSNALYKKAKNIVNRANKELCTNNQHQFFLTLFLGVLKIEKRKLYYCNAAHTTAIVLKEDGTMIDLNQSHGLPLGLYPEKEYTDSKINLERNDTIILYTDGVTELQNANKEQYGILRFKELLQTLVGNSPAKMAEQIEKHLEEYQGDAKQYDDISLLIVKFKA